MAVRTKFKVGRLIAGVVLTVLSGVNIVVSGISVNGAGSAVKALTFIGGMTLLLNSMWTSWRTVLIGVCAATTAFLAAKPLLEQLGVGH